MSKYSDAELDQIIKRAANEAAQEAVPAAARQAAIEATLEAVPAAARQAAREAVQEVVPVAARQAAREVVPAAARKAAKEAAREVARLAAHEAAQVAARDAARDAVAFYDEVIERRFGLVMEALDFIRQKLDNKVERQEFDDSEQRSEVTRLALKDTNRDLRNHDKRITKLEQKVFHA